MRHFDYTSARTVDETIQLLGQDEHVRPLAGGTDLITLMKADIAAPHHLVDIKRLDELPHTIDVGEQGTTIGALATLADLELSESVQRAHPAVAQAAGLAATPQLRNMATVGGNLLQRPRCWYYRHAHFHCWLKGGDECHARDGQNQLHALFGDSPCVAVHPSDLASALLALDADVRLRGPGGERSLALDDFFTLPTDDHRRETDIAPDELLVSVHIPKAKHTTPQHTTRSRYLKAMDRKVWAFALVGVAARLDLEGSTVTNARLVLSGVAPVPWRLREAEHILIGEPLDAGRIARVADAALADAKPLEYNGYKIPLARNLIVRALTTLAPG
jgi:xanthine dehydrogenase YagS FAD-binding subunit